MIKCFGSFVVKIIEKILLQDFSIFINSLEIRISIDTNFFNPAFVISEIFNGEERKMRQSSFESLFILITTEVNDFQLSLSILVAVFVDFLISSLQLSFERLAPRSPFCRHENSNHFCPLHSFVSDFLVIFIIVVGQTTDVASWLCHTLF